MSNTRSFEPNWTSPPGETIAEILVERRISVEAFSDSLGQSVSDTKQLLSGAARLDSNVASKLTAVLGGSLEYWSNRESQFRSSILRIASRGSAEENRNWLRSLPLNDLRKLEWVASSSKTSNEKLCEAFRFFGVSSVREWREKYDGFRKRVALRSSPAFESQYESLVSWLRVGEIESANREFVDWDAERFRSEISEVRKLTRKKNPSSFIPKLIDHCQRSGVCLVVSKAPSKCRASGATFFTSDGRPILMLSFRYRSDDHFWFTFFHEVGHLLLHSEESCFVELNDPIDSPQELEANEFAANILIPRSQLDVMLQLGSNAKRIIRFAHEIGVSPGVVVGQMQHYGVLGPHQQSGLKRRYSWTGNNIAITPEME